MVLVDNFLKLIRGGFGKTSYIGGDCIDFPTTEDVFIEYAYSLCVQIIGNLVGMCEKEVFKKGTRDYDKLYWQLNFSPNKNESAMTFWKKIVNKIFYENGEALVVKVGGNYYVADSFVKEEKVFIDSLYRDVYVGGQKIRSQEVFKESEVFYFDMRDFLRDKATMSAGFYNKIMNVVSKQYLKKKYNKLVFEVPAMSPLNPSQDEIRMNEAFKQGAKSFIQDEKDSILITDGNIKVGKYESVMGEGYTDDGANIVMYGDNILQIIANMFCLPLGALKGEDVSLNTHINLFLRGFLDLIEVEINRKRFNQYSYFDGSKVRITTVNVEKTTGEERARTNDLNLRSGIYNVNEIRRELGLEYIDKEWANTHFMTLNYDVIDKFITGEQGSGGNVNKNSPVSQPNEGKEDNVDGEE